MTVEDLKALLEDLPDDMRVIMPTGNGAYLAVCRRTSGVIPVTYPNSPKEEMVVLFPCYCGSKANNNDDAIGEINLN